MDPPAREGRSARSRPPRRLRLAIGSGGALGALCLASVWLTGALPFAGIAAASSGSGDGLAPLSSVTVPKPTNLGSYVANQSAAIKLGKSLFWDMQAGSDGRTACATCHFAAGADDRSTNQLNPGAAGAFTGNFGPNHTLTAADYPFHRLADPDNRDSQVLSDTTAVGGSQGVIPQTFTGVVPGSAIDSALDAAIDPVFKVGGVNVRRATGRNTPSVINAVFNFRNFWDGRAQNDFNGVNPFGSRDPSARLVAADGSGNLSLVQVGNSAVAPKITNASLASQADGPPGNPTEMSGSGRTLSDIGKKLLTLTPLGGQKVSSSDSVLGSLAVANGPGLTASYSSLVQAAFKPAFWSSNQVVEVGPNGPFINPSANPNNLAPNQYTAMQFNWSLFWGLAINLYESTLVSDQTPMDKFLAGNSSALGSMEQKGLGIFRSGKANCSSCHFGPELTSESVSNIGKVGTVSSFSQDGRKGTFDTGFINIGIRRTADDGGQGGQDPFHNSLSIAKLTGQPNLAVDGSFKVPGLRNIALTAPYFHNGGDLTLMDVVNAYNRGMNFANAQQHPFIKPLGLSETDKQALVAFMTNGLTDPRVVKQSAPFDHPQLFIPNGHVGNQTTVQTDGGRAKDAWVELPATGGAGGAPLQLFPIQANNPAPPAPSNNTPAP